MVDAVVFRWLKIGLLNCNVGVFIPYCLLRRGGICLSIFKNKFIFIFEVLRYGIFIGILLSGGNYLLTNIELS